MTKQHKLLSLAACMSAAFVASTAMAADTPAAQTSVDLPRRLDVYVCLLYTSDAADEL